MIGSHLPRIEVRLVRNSDLDSAYCSGHQVVDQGSNETTDVTKYAVQDWEQNDHEAATRGRQAGGCRNERGQQEKAYRKENAQRNISSAYYQRELARLDSRYAPNARLFAPPLMCE